MKALCTDVSTTKDHLIVSLDIKWRGAQPSLRVRVPWKWIASTDAIEHIEAELAKRSRHRERQGRPWLPLESWE